jgi:hypothetical protein
MSSGEHEAAEEIVAKLAVWIEPSRKVNEGTHALVSGTDFACRHREQLRPMRSWIEWRKRRLDMGEDVANGGPVWLPREVNGNGCAVIGRAQPQVVGGDRAYLRDLDDASDPLPQRDERQQGLGRDRAVDEVFGL